MPVDGAPLTARLEVGGRVQGVGFRAAMASAARAIGATGWVRNLGDGSVEAMVQGDKQQVEQVVRWCHSGPPGAQVLRVDVQWVATGTVFGSFATRPSA